MNSRQHCDFYVNLVNTSVMKISSKFIAFDVNLHISYLEEGFLQSAYHILQLFIVDSNANSIKGEISMETNKCIQTFQINLVQTSDYLPLTLKIHVG